jgi:oxygen-independent coproporphyrinogen-3 oxidase
LAALERELSWLGEPREVDTLFCGGGTPTQLAPEHLERLFALVRHWFPFSADGEFSVEANPEDIDWTKIEILRAAGVNRVSLGVQSLADYKLARLERNHRAADVERCVHELRPHVSSLAIDLIFGAPREDLSSWQDDLSRAIALDPDHVSTYALTYERGTQFWARLRKGELTPVDEESERAMYETAIDTLTGAGWEHYEVSNFARPGHRCRHNEAYWLGREYYACGPGAARYVNGRREVNHRSTTTYLRRVLQGQSPVAESETLSAEDRAREHLVFALRRLEGVDSEVFLERTGFGLSELVGDVLPKFIAAGLLELDHGRLRLTRSGLMVSDSMWPEFLRR